MKSNNTHLNLLMSYAYCGKSNSFNEIMVTESMQGNCNLMIDSGAFTIHNSKTKSKLNLDSYCKYLELNAHKVEKYVMLDVIRNDSKTKMNYETMLQRGLNPMFVFTEQDNDWDYLKNAVKNQRHLCVAGGVANKGNWMFKRYQDVYNKTGADIHGLGFVKYPEMYQLPLHSVDSSTWIQSSQVYGRISHFDNGIKNEPYKEYITGRKKLPILLKRKLEEFEITPKMFLDIENHKGGKSIATLINTNAFIEYQIYSKKLGVNLFLAVNNTAQAKNIFTLNEAMNKKTLTYEKYKQIMK